MKEGHLLFAYVGLVNLHETASFVQIQNVPVTGRPLYTWIPDIIIWMQLIFNGWFTHTDSDSYSKIPKSRIHTQRFRRVGFILKDSEESDSYSKIPKSRIHTQRFRRVGFILKDSEESDSYSKIPKSRIHTQRFRRVGFILKDSEESDSYSKIPKSRIHTQRFRRVSLWLQLYYVEISHYTDLDSDFNPNCTV